MKKLLALLLVLSLVFVLSACKFDKDKKHKQKSSQPTESKVVETSGIEPTISAPLNNGKISRNTAIKIALAHANLEKSKAIDLDAELDRTHGGIYWEVDFEYNGQEYTYYIDTETGDIMRIEAEMD